MIKLFIAQLTWNTNLTIPYNHNQKVDQPEIPISINRPLLTRTLVFVFNSVNLKL
jgi:hypothetical protein